MMLPFQKSIITKHRTGKSDSPYVDVQESQQVLNGKVVLSEIPDSYHRLKVTSSDGTVFVETKGKIKETNQYQMDYNGNLVSFHPIHNGKLLHFTYKGVGNHYISSSIIYTKEENGDVVETLDELINTTRNTHEDIIAANNEISQNEASRKNNESQRIIDENIRIQNEEDRELFESNRLKDETTRQSNESSRIQSESQRVLEEDKRKLNESSRMVNENQRITDENIRKTNEDLRLSEEIARTNSENTRNSKEATRQENESKRVVSEDTRKNAEENRNINESTRILNENIRNLDEDDRLLSEQQRKDNEELRITAESIREQSEDAREMNEINRVDNEDDRQLYEMDRQEQESVRQSHEEQRQIKTQNAIDNANRATMDAINASDLANGKAEIADVKITELQNVINSADGLIINKIVEIDELGTTAINDKMESIQLQYNTQEYEWSTVMDAKFATIDSKIVIVDQKISELQSTIDSADSRIGNKVSEIDEYGTTRVDNKITEINNIFVDNIEQWDATVVGKIEEVNAQQVTWNNQEDARELAEDSRQSSESNRESNESQRQLNEEERISKINSFTHMGEYLSTIQYTPRNIVSYQGSSYMCIKQAKGVSPTNTEYWKLSSVRGSNLTFRGVYDSNIEYLQNEIVSYNDHPFVCIKDTYAGIGVDDTTYWVSFLPESMYESNVEEIIATEGQTVFHLIKGTYNPNQDMIAVYVWGTRQPSSAYIQSSPTSITMKTGLPSGAKVIIEYSKFKHAKIFTSAGTDLNTFEIGDGASGYKSIIANDGSTNKPTIRFNNTNNRWQITNNGIDYFDVISLKETLQIGETSSTAYRGDRGRIAYNHSLEKGNPHGTTKADVGLSNVDNKSSEAIRSEITNKNITDSLGYTPENVTNKGIANGYASLDSNAKIPLNQLPDTSKQQTYIVTDTIERNSLTDLLSGDRCYEKSTGDSFIWDGAVWHTLSKSDWENVNLSWTNIIDRPTDLETIAGSEEKANQVETNAKSYTDTEIAKLDSTYATDIALESHINDHSMHFSGNYDDLTNKPSIPAKNSELLNDSEFISLPYVAGKTPPSNKKLFWIDTNN